MSEKHAIQVEFEGCQVSVPRGSSLLDALLAHGQMVPHGCRAGVCQSCVLKMEDGEMPRDAQIGLKSNLRAAGYFLACLSQPHAWLKASRSHMQNHELSAMVMDKRLLGQDTWRLRLLPDDIFNYRAGQFATLWKDEMRGRTYSLASVPELDPYLEFHIQQLPGGEFSGWVADQLQHGDMLRIRGPGGNCFYAPGNPDRPLLLAGTGTGLAPLYGIVRDALRRGHRAPIWLFHGARHGAGLYLHDQLSALCNGFPQMRYEGWHLEGEGPAHAQRGDLVARLRDFGRHLGGWGVYLCGSATFVHSMRKTLFLAGAGLADIHADAFLPGARAVAEGALTEATAD